MKNSSYLLHELSWQDISEIDKDRTIMILPIGSTEQHGPQNPIGTDFLIAEHIAHKTAEQSSFAYCLPTIPVGVASHHRNFPGTLWVSHEVLEEYITDVLNSLHYHGFDKVLLINGHGGNTSSISNAISYCNDTLEMTCILFEWWQNSSLVEEIFEGKSCGHADAVETSVIFATRPDLVHTDKFDSLTSASKWGREIGGLYLHSRTDQFTSSGIAGSIDGISQEKGEKLLRMTISTLIKAIEDISKS
jgi:creatinine amidohydrolase